MAALENNGGRVILDNVYLRSNTTGINGGGLHIGGAGTANIGGCIVSDNTAGQEGGGLWNSAGGTMTVRSSGARHSTIFANTANGDGIEQGGGGVFNDGGLVEIFNATIANNAATASTAGNGGGGIFNDGRMNLRDVNLSGNLANAGTQGSGGAIFNSDGGVFDGQGLFISANRASRAGGGIENNNGQVTLSNFTMRANNAGSAPGNGGGMHISGTGNAVLINGIVTGNTATLEGGGLWNSTGRMTVTNVTLSNNTAAGAAADDGGGGIFNNGGDVEIINSLLLRNAATGTAGSGGGTFNLGGTLDITGTTFSGNRASRAGGGIEDAAGTSVVINASTLIGNTTGNAPGNGGGLHITGAGNVRLDSSTVASNTASAEGGGLWNSAVGTLTVNNSTISNNRANGTGPDAGGGGVYNDGGAVTITNATIASNISPDGAGGGIFSQMNASTSVGNSIVATNTAMQGIDVFGAFTSLGYNLIGTTLDSSGFDESTDKTGTTARLDPKLGPLADNGGPTLTRALLSGSPAINAGGGSNAPSFDQRGSGFPRVANGQIDIGAFEVQ